MNSFLIQGARAASSLEFFERTPVDPGLPIERFKARLADQDFSAVGRIYIGSTETHPADLFARMAANWKGWPDSFMWESEDGGLALRLRTGSQWPRLDPSRAALRSHERGLDGHRNRPSGGGPTGGTRPRRGALLRAIGQPGASPGAGVMNAQPRRGRRVFTHAPVFFQFQRRIAL